MKHILVSILMLVSSYSYAANSNTLTGSISFQGIIENGTCEVETINGNSEAISVRFGNISPTTLENDGDSTTLKEFNLVISKCPPFTTFTDILFSGTTAADRDDLYVLASSSGNELTTAGLLLEVMPDGKNYVNTLDGLQKLDPTKVISSTIHAGTVTIPLRASIQRIGNDTLETGGFISVANFTMTYQ